MKSTPYTTLEDQARLEYGRLLWKNERTRAMLLGHWNDPRHPYRERFQAREHLVREILGKSEDEDEALDASLRLRGESLRSVAREIPPVFGSFWGQTRQSVTEKFGTDP